MLRIAVPNKGSLSDAARETLSEAGYRQRRDSKELVLVDPENSVEFFYLRPRDIAIYVAKGTLDAGLTGRDLFLMLKSVMQPKKSWDWALHAPHSVLRPRLGNSPLFEN